MQAFVRFLSFAAVALAVSACGSLGVPRELTLSQADLQTLIERQFPRERRVFEFVDISLARPSIRLAPERNRIVTELDLSAHERLSGKSVRGNLAIDHALRYEPSDATVRLAQVRVNDMKLEVGGTTLSGQTARLGALLTERLLDDFVIYQVSDERREAMRRAGLNAATVAVTSRGIEVRFTETPR